MPSIKESKPEFHDRDSPRRKEKSRQQQQGNHDDDKKLMSPQELIGFLQEENVKESKNEEYQKHRALLSAESKLGLAENAKTQLGVEEMTDILTHVNRSDRDGRPIRWQLISTILQGTASPPKEIDVGTESVVSGVTFRTTSTGALLEVFEN